MKNFLDKIRDAFWKFVSKSFNILLLTICIAFLIFTVVYGFVTVSLEEPKEYGICIEKIKNNSNQEVVFINLLERSLFKVKPNETVEISSWLASINTKKVYSIFGITLFVHHYGSFVEERNPYNPGSRSCILVIGDELYILSLGRTRSVGKLDAFSRIRVTGKYDDEYEGLTSYRTVEGYSIVSSDTLNEKRILIINKEVEPRFNEVKPESYNFTRDFDFEIRLANNPELKTKSGGYCIVAFNEFYDYKNGLDKNKKLCLK